MRKFHSFRNSCPEPGIKINVSSFLAAQPRASICESVEYAEVGTVLLMSPRCCFSSEDEQGFAPQELLCLCETNTFFISFYVRMLVLTLALHTVCHVTGGVSIFQKKSLQHVSQRKGHLCSGLGTAGGGDSSGFLSLGLPHSSCLTSKREEATTVPPAAAHSTARRLYTTSPDITSPWKHVPATLHSGFLPPCLCRREAWS